MGVTEVGLAAVAENLWLPDCTDLKGEDSTGDEGKLAFHGEDFLSHSALGLSSFWEHPFFFFSLSGFFFGGVGVEEGGGGSLSDLLWGRAYCAVSDIQLFCFFLLSFICCCLFFIDLYICEVDRKSGIFCLCRESIAHIVSCPNWLWQYDCRL